MFSQRLFKISVAIALLLVIGLTVREAAATTVVVSHTSSADTACAGLSPYYPMHTEYVQERRAWVTSTEDGPTGVDGGLIELLSNYRTCSQ